MGIQSPDHRGKRVGLCTALGLFVGIVAALLAGHWERYPAAGLFVGMIVGLLLDAYSSKRP